MQLQYAAENLIVIPAEHFLARRAGDLAATKKLAKDDPVALVRNILESLDGKATAQKISEWMVPDLFTEGEWKMRRSFSSVCGPIPTTVSIPLH